MRDRSFRLDRAATAQLHVRPLWRPIVHTGAIGLLYAGLSILVTANRLGPVRFIVWPVMGLILTGFLNAAHDCLHNTFLDSKRSNRVAGSLWCALILKNFTLFKHSHLVHHRYTRVPGDTEPPMHFPTASAYFGSFFRVAIVAWLGRCVGTTLGRFPPFIDTDEKRRAVRQDNVVVGAWLIVIVILTCLSPRVVIEIYWVPTLFIAPMLHLTALPEHYGCDEGSRVYDNTRSVVSNALLRFIMWNGNYHAQHHLYPRVPSCNLPRLYDLTAGQFRYHARGYFAFHASVAKTLWSRTRMDGAGKPEYES